MNHLAYNIVQHKRGAAYKEEGFQNLVKHPACETLIV